jgi:hypothetical protein
MKIGIFSNSINFINGVLERHEGKVVFVVFDSLQNGKIKSNLKNERTFFFDYSDYEIYTEFLSTIDILFCYDFRILPRKIIEKPKLCSINFHPASLPEFAGRYPWPMLVEAKLKSSCISAHFMKENPDSGRVIRTSEYPLYNNDYYKAWKSRTEMESINLASFILNRKFLVVKLLFLKFFRGPKLNHNPNSSVSSRRIVRPDLGHVYDVIRINSEIGGTNFYYNFGKKITIFKVKQTNIELTMHKSILNQLNIYCLTENHKAYISNGYGHLEIQDYVGEIPESITYLEFNNA